MLTFETRHKSWIRMPDQREGPSVPSGKRTDLVDDMSRPFGFEIPMGGTLRITTVGLVAAVWADLKSEHRSESRSGSKSHLKC